MRPKGSLDAKKRKRKTFLLLGQERKIIEQHKGGMGKPANLYSISKITISSLCESRVNQKDICGICDLCFVDKKITMISSYMLALVPILKID